MKHFIFVWIVLMAIISACTGENEINPTNHPNGDGWLIPAGEVLYMNKPKDRIPSIDHPEFVPISISELKEEDIVFVVQHQGETRVYPQQILNSHEIVNDVIQNLYYSVTYCPLTGSGMAWNRTINDKVTEFGVSGMLFRENLIPYDRNTQSHWSQMKGMCVQGDLAGEVPEYLFLLKTKFSTVKRGYPEAKVLVHSKCDSLVCETFKNGNATHNEPGDDDNIHLPADGKYLGVAAGESLLLTNLAVFDETIQLFRTHFRSKSLLVCGSRQMMIYVVFHPFESHTTINYQPVQNKFPIVMRDNLGNEFDVFGKVMHGPDRGKRLKSPVFYQARTFAWQSFFSDVDLME